MTEDRWVRRRRERWAELRVLLERVRKRRLRSLSGREVVRLGALYREAASDLATARTQGFGEETVGHLNRLCAAAHDVVYAGRRSGGLARVARFLAAGFPALVRRTLPFHAAAFGVFALSAVGAYAVFRLDPALAERTLGPTFALRAEAARETGRYIPDQGLLAPVFSWGIIANNVNVTLLAYAFGCAFAVPGLVVLVVNGVHIGGGFAVFADAGVAGTIGTFVVAHGPLELSSIFVAAGAGLRVGTALLLPGRRRRATAFREAGGESVRLLAGTAALLAVAGTIEGFVSPSSLPAAVKVATGAVTGALLAAYLVFGGRVRGRSGAVAARSSR